MNRIAAELRKKELDAVEKLEHRTRIQRGMSDIPDDTIENTVAHGLDYDNNWVAKANKQPIVIRKNGKLLTGSQEDLARYV